MYIACLMFYPFLLTSQVPISQVEGYLEVYHPSDSTSLYVGKEAGQMVDTFERMNTIIGGLAGRMNYTGRRNSFLGFKAGYSNISGEENCFFGYQAGRDNQTGNRNSFFGSFAGSKNIDGPENSFFGRSAGSKNKNGSNNSYFGRAAGNNIDGNKNVCLGDDSGPLNLATANLSYRLFIDVHKSNTPLIYGEFDNNIVAINGDLGVDDNSPGHTLSLGQSTATTKLALYESDVDPNNNYGLGVTSGTFRFNLGNPNARYAFFDAPGGSANEIFTIKGNGEVKVNGGVVHSSDRNRKQNIQDMDYEKILQNLMKMPVYSWQYKGNDRRHIGPMAQDFHVAFGLGNDDTVISSIDADGVALAAIKALLAQHKLLNESIRQLQEKVDSLNVALQKLQRQK